MKPWIQTRTGHAAFPLAMTPEMVDVIDIAHALGNLCRFTGHVQTFTSVAEHSVQVSLLVPPEDALAGLMHDAAEAYLGDVAAPIKQNTFLLVEGHVVPFHEVERRVHAAICDKLGIAHLIPPSVKEVDLRMLMTEKSALLGTEPLPWSIESEPYPFIPPCWSPRTATEHFLKRFMELYDGPTL